MYLRYVSPGANYLTIRFVDMSDAKNMPVDVRTEAELKRCLILVGFIAGILAAAAVSPAAPSETTGSAAQARPAARSRQGLHASLIDGLLDDPSWTDGRSSTASRPSSPTSARTPARRPRPTSLYDGDNLYFAFRCYDSDPAKIKASICKRDAMFSDDFVGIILDTYNTMQSGYGFLVNPLGIQGDGMMDVNGNVDDEHRLRLVQQGPDRRPGLYRRVPDPPPEHPLPRREDHDHAPRLLPPVRPDLGTASSPPIYPDKAASSPRPSPCRVSGLKFKRVVELLPGRDLRAIELGQAKGELVSGTSA